MTSKKSLGDDADTLTRENRETECLPDRLTSAGKLPFKAISHVAGINMLWRASGRSIRDSVRNAIKITQAAVRELYDSESKDPIYWFRQDCSASPPLQCRFAKGKFRTLDTSTSSLASIAF